ncbi:hypothetical protein GOBAR_DD18473 [Gossypium barbadense]|nr:hypothetical protein GOBAR_DD18473 [Gossypium barbadense]
MIDLFCQYLFWSAYFAMKTPFLSMPVIHGGSFANCDNLVVVVKALCGPSMRQVLKVTHNFLVELDEGMLWQLLALL